MRSRRLVSAGVELDVYDRGRGEALLFLHGFRDFFAEPTFVDQVTSSLRLIAPTHPGFGPAPVPEWFGASDDAAHIYLSLLDDLGIENFHLAGAALGGWIAAEMATMAPERIKSLTLVAPVGVKLGSKDTLDVPDLYKLSNQDLLGSFHSEQTHPVFDPASMSDEELMDFVRSREALALYAWEPWMHNPKLRHRLSRAHSRTVFVRGSKDRLIAEWYVQSYAKLLPNVSEIKSLPEVGHDVLREAPKELADIIIANSANAAVSSASSN